ncbi:MAG: DUF488 domain-containing protein [bacterium]
MIKLKSVYSQRINGDGKRILIDLFWPEGLKTHEAHIDQWLQKLGPSYDLQRFEFRPESWESYKSMYKKELLASTEKKILIEDLVQQAKSGVITFLYGNKDSAHNNASVVKELLESDFLN